MDEMDTAAHTLQRPMAPSGVGAAAGAEVIALHNAAVRIGERVVWERADVRVSSGEFIAIVGPNGSGKTTLLRVVLGLLPLAEGDILVFGHRPRRGDPAIGYMPQRHEISPDLVVRGWDLVALGVDGHRWGFAMPGPALRRSRVLVQEALVSVEAEMHAGRPIGQLSGGEQQRLWLAQALVGYPRLLLLDEPLANLDPRNAAEISRLITRLARERAITVLLVTHDVNPLLHAVDRVLYVAHGRVAIGTPDEIVTTERLSRLYDAPVEVVRDERGRVFVVGLENEVAHPHPA